jgi:NTP pyrophosphatase (non-canonical NTP hydrolase)
MENNTVFEKIRVWATVRGLYEKGDTTTQFVKLSEESGELARGLLKKDDQLVKDSIGDMVVVLTNLAHLHGTTIEECIDLAWEEIKDRKGSMQNGTFTKDE